MPAISTSPYLLPCQILACEPPSAEVAAPLRSRSKCAFASEKVLLPVPPLPPWPCGEPISCLPALANGCLGPLSIPRDGPVGLLSRELVAPASAISILSGVRPRDARSRR